MEQLGWKEGQGVPQRHRVRAGCQREGLELGKGGGGGSQLTAEVTSAISFATAAPLAVLPSRRYGSSGAVRSVIAQDKEGRTPSTM